MLPQLFVLVTMVLAVFKVCQLFSGTASTATASMPLLNVLQDGGSMWAGYSQKCLVWALLAAVKKRAPGRTRAAPGRRPGGASHLGGERAEAAALSERSCAGGIAQCGGFAGMVS